MSKKATKTKKATRARKATKVKTESATRTPRAGSLRDRLANGTDAFVTGPYKTAHVAQSYRSQANRLANEIAPGVWQIKTQVEDLTVRFERAAA